MKRLLTACVLFSVVCAMNYTAYGYANDAIQRARAQRLQDMDNKVNELNTQKNEINRRSDLTDREKQVQTKSLDREINLYTRKSDSIENTMNKIEGTTSQKAPSASQLQRKKYQDKQTQRSIQLLEEEKADIDSDSSLTETQKTLKKRSIDKQIQRYKQKLQK